MKTNITLTSQTSQETKKPHSEIPLKAGLKPQQIVAAQLLLKDIQKSIDEGSAEALYHLGVIYGQGLIVEMNAQEEIRLYKLAIEKGCKEAKYNLAVIFKEGLGASINLNEAARLFREAGNEGHLLGKYNYAVMQYCGIGMECNIPEAIKTYEEVAAKGLAEAQCALGRARYMQGNFAEAFKFYELSAQQGYANGQFYLGLMYYLNQCPENKSPLDNAKEMLRLFNLSALQNFAPSLAYLGITYRDGLMIDKDLQKAYEFLKAGLEKQTSPNQAGFLDQVPGFINEVKIEWRAEFFKNIELINSMLENSAPLTEEKKKSYIELYNKCRAYIKEFKSDKTLFKEQTEILKKVEILVKKFNASKAQENKTEEIKQEVAYLPYGMVVPKMVTVITKKETKENSSKTATDIDPYDINHVDSLMKNYSDSFELILLYQKKMARMGSAAALYDLGICYYGMNKSEKGLKNLTLAAKKGHAAAQHSLGKINLEKGNLIEARRLFELSAAQGNADAQNSLGKIYLDEDNIKEARRFYGLAATQKHIAALHNFGATYYIVGDSTEAFKWFLLSAQQGNPASNANVGMMYRKGDGIERDDAKAMKFLEFAVEKGDPADKSTRESCYELAMIYFKEADQKDLQKSFKYFYKYAQKNDVKFKKQFDLLKKDWLKEFYNDLNSLNKILKDTKSPSEEIEELYNRCRTQIDEYNKNYLEFDKIAFEKFNKLKERFPQLTKFPSESKTQSSTPPNPSCEETKYKLSVINFKLGKQYNDKGDFKKAETHYKLAANSNHPLAQNNLGRLYFNGDVDIENNIYEAERLFRAGSDLGNHEATYNLAVLYLTRINNITLALELFQKSANNGFIEAQFYLGILYFEGKLITQDLEESAKYYKLAAKQSHKNAQYNLGILYQKGIGVQKDLHKAYKYIQSSLINDTKLDQIDKEWKIEFEENLKSLDEMVKNSTTPNEEMDRLHDNCKKYIKYKNLKLDESKAKILEDIQKKLLQAEKFEEIKEPNTLKKSIEDLKPETITQENKAENIAPAEEKQSITEQKPKKTPTKKPFSKKTTKTIKEEKLALEENSSDVTYLRTYNYLLKKHSTPLEAYKYQEKMADLKVPAALNDFGMRFYKDDDEYVKQDLKEAATYFRLASEKNNADAQYNLARMHEKGEIKNSDNTINWDHQEKERLYLLAANQNHTKAQFSLAKMYHESEGIEQNLPEAVKFYGLAADNGHTEALYKLAGIYRHGGKGVDQDLSKALTLYESCRILGHPEAQLRISNIKRIISKNERTSQPKVRIILPKEKYRKSSEDSEQKEGETAEPLALKDSKKTLEYRLFIALAFNKKSNLEEKEGENNEQNFAKEIFSKGERKYDLERFSAQDQKLFKDTLRFILFEKTSGDEKKLKIFIKKWYKNLNHEIKNLPKNLSEEERNVKINELIANDKLLQSIQQKLNSQDEVLKAKPKLSKKTAKNLTKKPEKEKLKSAQDFFVETLFFKAFGDNEKSSEALQEVNQAIYLEKLNRKEREKMDPFLTNNFRNSVYNYTLTSCESNFKDADFYQKANKEYIANIRNELGNTYYSQHKYKKAFSYFKSAAQLGDEKAQFSLAMMHLEKKVANADLNEAIKIFESLAAKGDSNAQQNLNSILYSLGVINYNDGNHKLGLEYLKSAQKHGNPEAAYFLGIIYYEGKTVEKNLIKAAKNFQFAAKHNNLEAKFFLGLMNFGGIGIEQNLSKAEEYFKTIEENISEENQEKINILHELSEEAQDYCKPIAEKYSEFHPKFELLCIYNHDEFFSKLTLLREMSKDRVEINEADLESINDLHSKIVIKLYDKALNNLYDVCENYYSKHSYLGGAVSFKKAANLGEAEKYFEKLKGNKIEDKDTKEESKKGKEEKSENNDIKKLNNEKPTPSPKISPQIVEKTQERSSR